MTSHSFLPLLTICILLLNIFDVVDARTIPAKPFQLILSPIHLAAFILCILFCVLFALGALSALGKLGNTGKPLPSYRRGETYLTGKIYFFPLFLAFLSLVIYYALSAITIVYALNQSKADVKPVSPTLSAAMGAMLPLAHWFILCALLVLLFRRARVGRVGGPSRWYLYKFILDLVLLGIHLSILVAANSLQGALRRPTIKKVQEINRLSQTLLAFQVILTLDVVASAAWMWMALKAKSIPDSIMIGQIVKFIAPLLIVQEIYRIAEYNLYFTLIVRANFQAASSALFLSRIIIMGVTNFVILWFAV